MSLVAYEYGLEFHLVRSGCCDAVFMMDDGFYQQQQRLKENGGWYCPKCGSYRCFTGKSKEAVLREQLRAERDTNKFLRKQNEKERNRTRAQKAAKTRIKKRIHNGVCPCCNRSFQNLQKHMKHMHPDYVDKK